MTGMGEYGLSVHEAMKQCTLCPRNCHADRTAGQKGYCGQTAVLYAARAALHHWEEPCISGAAGSGIVFFSGCPLRCVFCQNHNIAQSKAGQAVSVERLSEIFLELQEKNANNVNLVTPTHFVPQIAAALERAKRNGLAIPVVYNTGSYEKADTLRRMEGLVDIYLPDLKYMSPELGKRYSNAPDYFETASAAIAEMVRQTGKPVFYEHSVGERASGDRTDSAAKVENGEAEKELLMRKGVIVRHLVLPGGSGDSKKILRYLHDTYGEQIYISIMNQYTPIAEFREFPELNHRVKRKVYERIVEYALQIGVENGFMQEGGTARESFIPEFDGEGL